MRTGFIANQDGVQAEYSTNNPWEFVIAGLTLLVLRLVCNSVKDSLRSYKPKSPKSPKLLDSPLTDQKEKYHDAFMIRDGKKIKFKIPHVFLMYLVNQLALNKRVFILSPKMRDLFVGSGENTSSIPCAASKQQVIGLKLKTEKVQPKKTQSMLTYTSPKSKENSDDQITFLVKEIQEDLERLKNELWTFRYPSGQYECFEYNNAEYLLKKIIFNIAKLNSSNDHELVKIKSDFIELAKKYFCSKYFGKKKEEDAAIKYIDDFFGTDLGSLTKCEIDQRVAKLKEILGGPTSTSTEAKPITYQNPATAQNPVTQLSMLQAIIKFFTSLVSPRFSVGLFSSKETDEVFKNAFSSYPSIKSTSV